MMYVLVCLHEKRNKNIIVFTQASINQFRKNIGLSLMNSRDQLINLTLRWSVKKNVQLYI